MTTTPSSNIQSNITSNTKSNTWLSAELATTIEADSTLRELLAPVHRWLNTLSVRNHSEHTLVAYFAGLNQLALFLRGKAFTILNGIEAAQANALVYYLLIGLVEETIFRGYLQLRFISSWGQWPAILVTALLYSLWQLPRILAQPQTTETAVVQVAMIFVHGIVLGYLMHRTGNVLAPGIYHGVSSWLGILP